MNHLLKINMLLVVALVMAGFCRGEILRISEVAEKAGADTERMVLKNERGEEVLFVKKRAVITGKDVANAQARVGQGDTIHVKLTDTGGAKMTKVTKKMRLGIDRLAIVVRGELVSAPTVGDVLHKSFEISGLGGFNERQALARELSGLPPMEKNSEPLKPIPRIETVPFTEEEYQQRKAMREKMGIFYLDSVPRMGALNKMLKKGMTRVQVEKLFGRPRVKIESPLEGGFYWLFEIAPEKRTVSQNGEVMIDGIKVNFSDGKTTHWSHSLSNIPREEKPVGLEESTLKVIMPEIDLSADDVDLIKYVEGIEIPDLNQTLNKRDLGSLLQILFTLQQIQNYKEKEGKATIKANCDFMKIMGKHFVEVATLRFFANQGRVGTVALCDCLEPYFVGELGLPVKTKPNGSVK